MKTKFSVLFFSMLMLLMNGYSNDDAIVEADVDFDVTMFAEFQKTLYPSLILGLTELERQEDDAVDYFKIRLKTNAKTDIKIVIEESKLNYETIINRKAVSGMIELVPSLKWKYDDLKNMSQPGLVDITFICYDQEKEIGRKNLKLSYRAINECVIAAKIEEEIFSFHFLMAAYINEDSPIVDGFLKDVLRENASLMGFVGYQRNEEEVVKQVAAIWVKCNFGLVKIIKQII